MSANPCKPTRSLQRRSLLPPLPLRTTLAVILAGALACDLLPLPSPCHPQHCHDWDPLAAVRVGEAKCPGPGFDDSDWSDNDSNETCANAYREDEECEWDEVHSATSEPREQCSQSASDSEQCFDDAVGDPGQDHEQRAVPAAGGEYTWQPPHELGFTDQQLWLWQSVEKTLNASIQGNVRSLGEKDGDAPEGHELNCPLLSLPPDTNSWPCKAYAGSADGWTFCTKNKVTGYHRDVGGDPESPDLRANAEGKSSGDTDATLYENLSFYPHTAVALSVPVKNP